MSLNVKRVAAVYRDLRKAQGNNKNEPGAARLIRETERRRTDRTTRGQGRSKIVTG